MLHVLGYAAGLLCPLGCAAMMWPMLRGRLGGKHEAPIEHPGASPAAEDALVGVAR